MCMIIPKKACFAITEHTLSPPPICNFLVKKQSLCHDKSKFPFS